MSLRAMVWAWEQKTTSSTVKLVLLALADNADEVGVCWPGHKYVAEKCQIAQETVRESLRKLEAAGLIRTENRTDNYGRPTSNLYHLPVSAIPSNTGVNPSNSVSNLPENHSSLFSSSSKKIQRENALAQQFETFWKEYPRHVNKQGALRAWKQVFKSTASNEELLKKVMVGLRAVRPIWARGEARFIPHAATWLNQRRWEDDLSTLAGRDDAPVQESWDELKARLKREDEAGR